MKFCLNLERKATYVVIIPPKVNVLTHEEDINEQELGNFYDIAYSIAYELEIHDNASKNTSNGFSGIPHKERKSCQFCYMRRNI